MAEHPDIERALNGDPISVQPQPVGHHLLAADHEDGYGATFNFYCTESGSWESETSLYERHVASDEAVREGWEQVLSAGTDGEAWDWDRLEATATWADHALLVIGITGRDDEDKDGHEVVICAVCGFAAPGVARLFATPATYAVRSRSTSHGDRLLPSVSRQGER